MGNAESTSSSPGGGSSVGGGGSSSGSGDRGRRRGGAGGSSRGAGGGGKNPSSSKHSSSKGGGSNKSTTSSASTAATEDVATRTQRVVGENLRELSQGFRKSLKKLEEQDHPAAALFDSMCGPYLDPRGEGNGSGGKGSGGGKAKGVKSSKSSSSDRNNEASSLYSEDVESEDDSRTISEDETNSTHDYGDVGGNSSLGGAESGGAGSRRKGSGRLSGKSSKEDETIESASYVSHSDGESHQDATATSAMLDGSTTTGPAQSTTSSVKSSGNKKHSKMSSKRSTTDDSSYDDMTEDETTAFSRSGINGVNNGRGGVKSNRSVVTQVEEVPSSLNKPLASAFAKRCYFTKSGIGKNTQHYEGLTLTGNVVLMLASAMKLKGCPTICDEDLRRVEQTYPNQFSRLPDELLLSSGWRRISKYCHFSNKPVPDGIPFFHSKQRLHSSGGYYFLLAAAVGMVRPMDVEPLNRDTLVLLETDFPTACDQAPKILVQDPDQWTLVDKFCFFSGGPINTDEDVFYQADFDGNLIFMLAFLSPSLTPTELYKLDLNHHHSHHSSCDSVTNSEFEPGLKSVAEVEEVESVYDLTERDFDDLKLYHLGPCRALPQYLLRPQAWTKVLPPHFLAARETALIRAQEYEMRNGSLAALPARAPSPASPVSLLASTQPDPQSPATRSFNATPTPTPLQGAPSGPVTPIPVLAAVPPSPQNTQSPVSVNTPTRPMSAPPPTGSEMDQPAVYDSPNPYRSGETQQHRHPEQEQHQHYHQQHQYQQQHHQPVHRTVPLERTISSPYPQGERHLPASASLQQEPPPPSPYRYKEKGAASPYHNLERSVAASPHHQGSVISSAGGSLLSNQQGSHISMHQEQKVSTVYSSHDPCVSSQYPLHPREMSMSNLHQLPHPHEANHYQLQETNAAAQYQSPQGSIGAAQFQSPQELNAASQFQSPQGSNVMSGYQPSQETNANDVAQFQSPQGSKLASQYVRQESEDAAQFQLTQKSMQFLQSRELNMTSHYQDSRTQHHQAQESHIGSQYPLPEHHTNGNCAPQFMEQNGDPTFSTREPNVASPYPHTESAVPSPPDNVDSAGLEHPPLESHSPTPYQQPPPYVSSPFLPTSQLQQPQGNVHEAFEQHQLSPALIPSMQQPQTRRDGDAFLGQQRAQLDPTWARSESPYNVHKHHQHQPIHAEVGYGKIQQQSPYGVALPLQRDVIKPTHTSPHREFQRQLEPPRPQHLSNQDENNIYPTDSASLPMDEAIAAHASSIHSSRQHFQGDTSANRLDPPEDEPPSLRKPDPRKSGFGRRAMSNGRSRSDRPSSASSEHDAGDIIKHATKARRALRSGRISASRAEPDETRYHAADGDVCDSPRTMASSTHTTHNDGEYSESSNFYRGPKLDDGFPMSHRYIRNGERGGNNERDTGKKDERVARPRSPNGSEYSNQSNSQNSTSFSSAFKGAQELLRRNRLKRYEMAKKKQKESGGGGVALDTTSVAKSSSSPAKSVIKTTTTPTPTTVAVPDDESLEPEPDVDVSSPDSAMTWGSESEVTSAVSGSSVWTDNSNNPDRSSRRALILQMAKARMKSNKNGGSEVGGGGSYDNHHRFKSPLRTTTKHRDGEEEKKLDTQSDFMGPDIDLTEDLD